MEPISAVLANRFCFELLFGICSAATVVCPRDDHILLMTRARNLEHPLKNLWPGGSLLPDQQK